MHVQSSGQRWIIWLTALILLFVALLAMPVMAQTFPPLTGRVVDNAKILSGEQTAALDGKLQALETSSGHQLVVAIVPDLQGYPIEDYGYRLLRNWEIGKKDVNDGVILLVAPTERKVRIEVGYGLEPVLTDAYSGIIINTQIVPRFKANDYPGGIDAGVDAIAEQIKLPPEQAKARVDAAALAAAQAGNAESDFPGIGFVLPIMAIFFFVVLPLLRRRGGRSYGGGSGLGSVILWSALDAATRGGGGSSWGGGGGSGGGFSGGGFSGGGGSSGGGGASGGW
ncbi:TPM domain-containing protein [Sphingomonas sp.]|uniref:TPM domain-containing protein n=1 Tax=Sphingomonas sp. TaxID=28214 RepID=UPI0025F3B662|nr:TPM domain-containing protein [Sphingomonas sp.]